MYTFSFNTTLAVNMLLFTALQHTVAEDEDECITTVTVQCNAAQALHINNAILAQCNSSDEELYGGYYIA